MPPDQYQAQAIVELVAHFNWSYISTINVQGSYGENGIRLVKEVSESPPTYNQSYDLHKNTVFF